MVPPPLIVLVPLYIYPLEKAWEPLLQSALAHPHIRFLTVINPSNGPGTAPLPDASYAAAMRELSRVPNIQPIGYVHCSYGKRPMGAVQRDIDLYVGWNSDFRMDGIFIDEAPSHPDHVEYMTSLSRHAHGLWQANLGRQSVNVYNPGVVASPAYFDAADYIVTFEQSEQHWNLDSARKSLSSLSPGQSCKSIAIIHSRQAHQRNGLEALVRQVKSMGFAGLYVTNQLGGGFTHWPEQWDRLVGEVGVQV